MRGRLFTVAAVALLAAFVPAQAGAAETPWTPVTPAPPVPDDLSAIGLFDVAAASATDVWAVGSGWLGITEPLITHWTGAGWSETKAPAVPNVEYGFSGADAVSPSDVWAIGTGQRLQVPDFSVVPVIAHYDGRAWSTVPPPTPPASSMDALFGIDMLSATDGWAVGWRQGPLTDPSQPLVARWRNGRWLALTVPRIAGGKLAQVFARSAGDVWAVGTVADSGLIMHFDGTRWTWTTIPPDDKPNAFTMLRSVTAVSATDAWAVGSSCVLPDDSDFAECEPLIARLSGGVWRVVPASGDGGTNLQDVVARSSDDVWVVGYDLPPGGRESNHVEHWDGQRFTTVPTGGSISVRGQLASALEGVTTLPGTTELWAVGWQETGPQVIRHS